MRNLKYILFCVLILASAIHLQALNSPSDYQSLKTQTAIARDSFQIELKENKQKGDEARIITEASGYLFDQFNSYFEAWYGTPWSFNGYTRIPRQGTISSDYFVMTVLEDMGFRIPRVSWAQSQDYQKIIDHLSDDVRIFAEGELELIYDYLYQQGEAIYIVGMERNIGFIYYYQGRIWFIHASSYQPEKGVMRESIMDKHALSDARKVIIGKLLQPKMTTMWINNKKFK